MGFRVVNNVTITNTGSSVRTAIPYGVVMDSSGNGSVVMLGNVVRIQPIGSDVHIKFGGDSVEATTDDTMIQAGAVETFSINRGSDTHIAVLGSAGTVEITIGSGEHSA